MKRTALILIVIIFIAGCSSHDNFVGAWVQYITPDTNTKDGLHNARLAAAKHASQDTINISKIDKVQYLFKFPQSNFTGILDGNVIGIDVASEGHILVKYDKNSDHLLIGKEGGSMQEFRRAK
jgi:hypothetical protein